MRTNIGLVIGTNVQAQDSELSAIAGLTSAADRLPYFTGSGAAALATFTAAGRALVDDADAAAQRATLGLVIGTDVQAYDATIVVDADIGVTVQGYDADTVKSDVVTAYTRQQTITAGTLSDGANIAWNLDTAQVAKVTLAGNRTLDNPTNMKDGGSYVLRVTQDGTGSRTLAFGSAYEWPGGVAPTLSTAAGAIDILQFNSDGTKMYGTYGLNFS
jgi:hypothetical protein